MPGTALSILPTLFCFSKTYVLNYYAILISYASYEYTHYIFLYIICIHNIIHKRIANTLFPEISFASAFGVYFF